MKIEKSSQSTPTSLRVAKLCMFFYVIYHYSKLFSPQTTLIDFYKVSLFGTKLGYSLRALFIAQIFKFSRLQQTGFFWNNPYMFIGDLRIMYTFGLG
jgi:hypothetical protein